MSRDKNDREIKVGDTVTVEADVKHTLGDDVILRTPDGTVIVVNACCCEVQEDE